MRGPGEFEQKDEMDIVSLTLRDCLGLSFQGIYIYLFIIIIIIIIIFHSLGLTLQRRNFRRGGRDTFPINRYYLFY